MTAQGISQFTLGTTNQDMGPFGHDNRRETFRYVVGAEGNFDALGTNWKWDADYQRSTNDVNAKTPGDEITSNYARAVDAVIDPASGRAACRVNTDAALPMTLPNAFPITSWVWA